MSMTTPDRPSSFSKWDLEKCMWLRAWWLLPPQ